MIKSDTGDRKFSMDKYMKNAAKAANPYCKKRRR